MSSAIAHSTSDEWQPDVIELAKQDCNVEILVLKIKNTYQSMVYEY